jgi:predicted nuclease of predicted toxin-antitoxin system
MARLYANENFPYPVVVKLRELGHDVLTIQETGKGNQKVSDTDVLSLAHREQRTVLTLNRKDFRHLHSQSTTHSGIIICTRDLDFIGQAHRIDAAIKGRNLLDGQLIRVNRPIA